MRIAVILLCFACTPDVDQVVLPPPPLPDGAKSLIIYFQGDSTFFYAIDLSPRGEAPPVEVIAPEWTHQDFVAVAFVYANPLSFYDLNAGVLGVVQSRRSCALQHPLAVATFDSAAPTWQSLDPPTHGAIGSLVDETTYGCDDVNLCRSFVTEDVELPSVKAALVLLRLDDHTALLALVDGRFFEVSRSAILERGDLAGLPAASGRITESGEIWLGGAGRIARGTREGGFVETALGEPLEVVGAVGVRGEGASLEAIAVGVVQMDDSDSATVAVHRYAGDQWTLLQRSNIEGASARRADVLWVGDEAIIVFGATTGLTWNGSALESFELDSVIPLFEPQLNDLAVHPDFGVVVGANDGFLHQRTVTGNWSAIQFAILGNGITAVEAVHEGFFFGGADGISNQFYPQSLQCGAERKIASDVERIVQLGPDVLVTGGNPDGSRRNTITWLSE